MVMQLDVRDDEEKAVRDGTQVSACSNKSIVVFATYRGNSGRGMFLKRK